MCVLFVTPVMRLWIKQGCCCYHPGLFDFMLLARVTLGTGCVIPTTTHLFSDTGEFSQPDVEILQRIITSHKALN